MTRTTSSSVLTVMNFIAGMALLIMLFPVAGKAQGKPAGVRTALELIDKRGFKPSQLASTAAPHA